MIEDARDFDGATLLRHLAAEFARLAEAVDEVQHTGAAIARADGTNDAQEFMVRLQAMDGMSQVLRDLQGLAIAAAASRLGQLPVEAAFLRRSLRMRSLAERLISGPAGDDDGHDPTAFLL